MPLRIVAIETSTRCPTVALTEGETVVAEVELPGGRSTAAELIPTLHRLMSDLSWSPTSVDVVACSLGPGSFTGLRIGLVTAKIWTARTPARLVGVPTLEIVASQALPHIADDRSAPPDRSHPSVIAVIPAPQRHYFVGAYRVGPHEALEETALEEARPAELASSLAPLETTPRRSWITGEMLGRWPAAELRSTLSSRGFRQVPPSAWRPRAATVARLAAARARHEQFDHPMSLQPIYLRRSYAEEKCETGPTTKDPA